MKKNLTTIILALCLGYLGGYVGGKSSQAPETNKASFAAVNSTHLSDYISSENLPDAASADSTQLEALQYKVGLLELQLEGLLQNINDDKSPTKQITETISSNLPVRPDRESLMAAGISTEKAEKLLRQMSQQEYERLELQNKIRRNKGVASNEYRKQLRELNQNRISLRSELGDNAYDKYLFASQQNNRVKISSVMSGSPAESAGFSSDDIILSYDNQKVLAWADIRRLTLEGEIGSYTNVDVLRNGERISLMVPRGTLGVQLEPVQLDPAE